MNRIHWLLFTIKYFRNWPVIYLKKFFGKRSNEAFLALRNGYVLTGPNKESVLTIFREIWDRQTYGDLGDMPVAPVIIDIGGHIGIFAFFALYKRPHAKVYVFEPDKKNFEYLVENIRLSKIGAKALVPSSFAVAGTRGTRSFSMDRDWSRNSSLYAAKSDHRLVSVDVNCITLSDVFTEFRLDHCDLLKIDCEGAEYEILMQSSAEVFKKIKEIVLELHPVPHQSGAALREFLTSQGYTTSFAGKDAMFLHAVRE